MKNFWKYAFVVLMICLCLGTLTGCGPSDGHGDLIIPGPSDGNNDEQEDDPPPPSYSCPFTDEQVTYISGLILPNLYATGYFVEDSDSNSYSETSLVITLKTTRKLKMMERGAVDSIIQESFSESDYECVSQYDEGALTLTITEKERQV